MFTNFKDFKESIIILYEYESKNRVHRSRAVQFNFSGLSTEFKILYNVWTVYLKTTLFVKLDTQIIYFNIKLNTVFYRTNILQFN